MAISQNHKLISVIIPLRNKEHKRLEEVINRLDHDVIGEIIIVDYLSDKPFLYKGKCGDIPIKVIRYEVPGPWNKAHAINIGVLNARFGYIMTLDADILLGPSLLDKIKSKLRKDSFIYTNKVSRVEIEDLSGDWKNNLKHSFPWHPNASFRDEAFNLATGGFQCFPKSWFHKIRGLDENLVYYGGMDNITIIEARRTSMNLIIINETILHLEHENQKEANLPKEEQRFAKYCKSRRWELMEKIVSDDYIKEEIYGMIEGPNTKLIDEYRDEYDDGEDIKEIEINKNIRIMIAVINNSSTLPELFVRSLLPLYETTKKIFPGAELRFIKSCQVNNMRNIAVTTAINENYDYLVCLDDDHEYPSEFIIKLLCHQKDFITGCTRQRVHPYYPTQFYKFLNPMKQNNNFVFCNGDEGLQKIECSGPVGMLMKVEALRDLKYPYYWMDYSENKYTLIPTNEEWTFHPQFVSNYVGGDYVFARQLLQKGKDLWLDSSVDFPHIISGLVDATSDTVDANVRLNDGTQ